MIFVDNQQRSSCKMENVQRLSLGSTREIWEKADIFKYGNSNI